jgi:hypothetical protein
MNQISFPPSGGLDQFQVSQRDGSEGENDGFSKLLSPGNGDLAIMTRKNLS